MPNLKVQNVTYRPFESGAVLADGLLAVKRPGGELAAALSSALFGVADIAGQFAERAATRKGQEQGRAAARAAKPLTSVEGGDLSTTVVPRDEVKPPPAGATLPDRTPSDVRDAITAAAARHGVNPAALLKIAQLESGLNPKAKNPQSTAGGLFQQIDENAAQYGVADRFDASQSADGAARFMRDNTAALRKALGRDPTLGELYLAHQQGAGGAIKLLKNPNASAASVIGARRVQLNGGTATMTAGEFASLWTKKAGDAPVGAGLGEMPTIDLAAGGYDVVQTRSPLSITHSDGDIHLTGRDTLFGRAYDAAATEHYQAQLNDEMLNASQQLFDKLGDDPEALREGLEELKDRQLGDHVPAQIRDDYELAFGKLQRTYLQKAQKAREDKLKVEAQDTWLAKGSQLAESLGRAQVGLDPANGDSADVLKAEAARLKQHYREGVARGVMTPKQAAEAAAKLDGDVAATWYTTQATGKGAEEIEALRTRLKEDYVAGKLPGVDAATWTAIDAGLQKKQNEQHVGTRAAQASLKASLADDLASLRDTGAGVEFGGAPLSFDTVKNVLGEAEALQWTEQRTDAQAVFSATHGMKALPDEEIEKRLQQLEPVSGAAGYARDRMVYDTAEKQANAILKQRRDDPAGAAEQAFADTAKIEDPLERVKARLKAQDALGIQPLQRQPLTNAEAGALADRIQLVEADPDALNAEMRGMMDDVQKTYGTYADEVVAQVLRQRGLRRDTSMIGASLMRELNIGVLPARDDVRSYINAQRRDMAADAMDGTPQKTKMLSRWASDAKPAKPPVAGRAKAPNAAQLQLLKNNPDLAPQFDAKFGKGASELFLKDRQPGQRRKLANGDVEVSYDDGWIEVTHADGTVDGRQGP
jgi:hypothetical protein